MLFRSGDAALQAGYDADAASDRRSGSMIACPIIRLERRDMGDRLWADRDRPGSIPRFCLARSDLETALFHDLHRCPPQWKANARGMAPGARRPDPRAPLPRVPLEKSAQLSGSGALDFKSLHATIELTAVDAHQFGGPGDIAVSLGKFAKYILAFIRLCGGAV